jgi:hypothetical protein
VTFSAAAAASAASTALPPAASISSPAATANGWEVATMPFVPYTAERLEMNGKDSTPLVSHKKLLLANQNKENH